MASLADGGRRRRPPSRLLASPPGREQAGVGLPTPGRIRWYTHAGDHADASTDAFVTQALNALEAAVARKKELARRLLAALAEIDSRLRECGAERRAHGEAERLQRRRRAALRRLPASVRSAYEIALKGGRVPPIAAVDDGACGVCRSRLPPQAIEAGGPGAVMACPGCDRLLDTAEAG